MLYMYICYIYIYIYIAKLFYFCHLKKLVRPETFGPTLVGLSCGVFPLGPPIKAL